MHGWLGRLGRNVPARKLAEVVMPICEDLAMQEHVPGFGRRTIAIECSDVCRYLHKHTTMELSYTL